MLGVGRNFIKITGNGNPQWFRISEGSYGGLGIIISIVSYVNVPPELYSIISYACDGYADLKAKSLSPSTNLVNKIKYKIENGTIKMWVMTTGTSAEVGVVFLSDAGFAKEVIEEEPPSDAVSPSLL